MDLESLRLFVDVARTGGFTTVARDKGVDPSSVSRAVAALERELGVRLLQRSTRRVTLTEAGALYLARVEGISADLEQAREAALAASSSPGGTLRMTCSVAFGQQRLTPLLPRFHAAYPQLRLELLFNNRNLNLVAERIDLAVRMRQSSGGELIATKLVDTRYHVVASPAWLAAHQAPRHPAELRGVRCLLLALPDIRAHWRFRDADGRIGEVNVAGDVVISDSLALQAAARAGMGPALLVDLLIAEDLAAGLLIDLFPDHRVTATEFETGAWLLYPSRAYLPAKVRAMIDFLRANVGR